MALRYSKRSADTSSLIGEYSNGIRSNPIPFIGQVAVDCRDRLEVFDDDYDASDGTGIRSRR